MQLATISVITATYNNVILTKLELYILHDDY